MLIFLPSHHDDTLPAAASRPPLLILLRLSSLLNTLLTSDPLCGQSGSSIPRTLKFQGHLKFQGLKIQDLTSPLPTVFPPNRIASRSIPSLQQHNGDVGVDITEIRDCIDSYPAQSPR
ncbi:hypothetical protein B0H13DRAFT_2316467 [Mycena leptocephala]|nr:hypothetical protein B0H13DRAFT_2316467 [Mycena leptocephala]